jgi:hypothetical protein
MVIFFYIVFAILVAVYANHKKRRGIIWFLLSILISPLLAFLILLIIGSAPRSVPMTEIGSIVLVCVICLAIGLVHYLIFLDKRKNIRSEMSEVFNTMSNVASAVAAYNGDLNSWPHCDGITAIRTSLGVSISTDRISSITVTSPRTEEIIITATIKGIDSRVDRKDLTLTGKPWERGILWIWGGTVPSYYVPKK